MKAHGVNTSPSYPLDLSDHIHRLAKGAGVGGDLRLQPAHCRGHSDSLLHYAIYGDIKSTTFTVKSHLTLGCDM